MLLTSVIIILREVLEAALLLSILLALSRTLSIKFRWLYWAAGMGLVGAVGYGLSMRTVSNTLDGVGQEVVNAMMQLSIYVCLIWLCHLFVRCSLTAATMTSRQSAVMGYIVVLLTIREGSEIFVYLSGFSHTPGVNQGLIVGSLIGAGIGLSISVLFYFILLSFKPQRVLWIGCSLLTLVGAGMCLQSSQLLIQADWLPAQHPVWDSSAVLSESSILGQVLYALVGYETRPTPLQLAIYISSLSIMTVLLYLTNRYWQQRGQSE
ncbi:Uncharacterised protein [Zhongshania aliphaticivorans]|uniref:Iron permease n=1 Tax=Zhongshania aliphaticivorans TaxID=1470434 RepID=A0A5S9MYH7_9GAMM|nr:FTR1 family protein [Zhongshania aliphaticivorans]CAA0082267.1 Uncharacterised protein [Zhongshania aliphaticivorans]CAA0084345.1 Uncharacterised protein [Zhongshania aliphaticivorans]